MVLSRDHRCTGFSSALEQKVPRKEQLVDDQRFDTWTRALARPGSRRRLVRALLAGGALVAASRRGLSDATARRVLAGPGDPCRTGAQCLGADAPLVCDWNGYNLSCCTYEGNRCGFDAACCGTAICLGGYCTSGDPPSCTGRGCACVTGTWNPCDYGLGCCPIYPYTPGGPGVCEYCR